MSKTITLEDMRQFYSEYRDQPKLQPLVGEISWASPEAIAERLRVWDQEKEGADE